MMAERRHRIFRSGSAMRVRAWTHRRIADRRSIKRKQAVLSQPQIVERAQFHDEVMWMLAVVDWLAKRGFSLLKKQWIESLGHRGWFQADHGAQSQLTTADLALRHGHK